MNKNMKTSMRSTQKSSQSNINHSTKPTLIAAMLGMTVLSASASTTVQLKPQAELKQVETPLQHIRINSKTAKAVASRLDALDYDILESSVTSKQLELIVSDKQLAALKAQGLSVTLIAKGRPFQDSPQAMALDAVDINSTQFAPPSGYRNLAQVMQELNAIAALNPGIAKVVDITAKYNLPSTIDGHHMYAIKISDNVNLEEDEPTSLIVSNHHVRELVTPVIALTAARNLVEQYASNASVKQAVDNSEIWIAANWNPDGYVHVFTSDNMWRKNRRQMSNGTGVDLNRNYPVGWSTSCSGSTSHSSETYKGPSAGSEVETQTMMAFGQDRRFSKVIDFHSSGREILWDYHPSCATHPFDNHQKEEGKIISIDAGYNNWRSATALGENFQWHLNKGANAYLMETHSSFQPSYSSARAEAAQLWPAILNYFNRAIPVVGHITDEAGNALTGVNVEVLNHNYPYNDDNLSGDFGRFQVHVPTGTYTLKLSKAGYPTVTQTVSAVTGSSQNLNVVLTGTVGDDVTPLSSGVTVNDLSGAKGENSYFKLSVPADVTSLSFTMAGGSGDADLYVRKGSKPTLTEYDCRPYIGGNSEKCDIDNPADGGDYYVMLTGYSSYAGTSLTGLWGSEIPSGPDTLDLSGLSANVGSQLDYTVSVPEGRSTLSVQMSGGSGDADVYVKFGSAPTTSDYDCRPYKAGNDESCHVTRTSDKAYIMIRAYAAYSGVSLTASSH